MLLAAALAVTLTLSACGPLPTAHTSSPATASVAPLMNASTISDPPSGPSVASLDEALLGEARLESVSNTSPAYYGAWFVVAAKPLVEATSLYVKQTTKQWANGQTQTTPPKSDDVSIPKLIMQPALTAAGTDVIGVRIASNESAGASSAASYRTFWYDAKADEAGDSRMLFISDGVDAVFPVILDRLEQDQRTNDGVVDDLRTENPEAALKAGGMLDSINFSTDGKLVAEFDDLAVTSGSVGTIEVQLPAQQVEPWLSDFGKRAQSAAQTPSKVQFPKSSGAVSSIPVTKPASDPAANSSKTATSGKPVTLPAGGPDCAKIDCVALTFDDGPGSHTERLLDMLAKEDVQATFFVLGQNVKAYPELVKRAMAAGHQIGNHSYSHPSLVKLSSAKILDEIRRTASAVKAATGKTPSGVRPPYGAMNKNVRSTLSGEPNSHIILWDVDTLDWKTRSAAATVAAVKKETKPGSIILMHDIHKQSVDAVPNVIKMLKAKDYTLVTVDQLLASEHPVSGKVYSQLG